MEDKLYLNMIVKDSEPCEIVKRSIDSVKDQVDGMYICVTYTDTKPESSELLTLLEGYGAELSFFKWTENFAEARQYALDQVPKGETNWVYWQDADDILKGADFLRDALATAVRWQWSGVFFVYWYRVIQDETGEVREIVIEHQRERIIRNNGTYQWKGMLHETLIGMRRENFKQYLYDKCIVVHLTTNERIEDALARNLKILEAQIEIEQHKDPRTLIYLGKAYFDKAVQVFMEEKDQEEAIKLRDEYFGKALSLFDEYLNGKGEVGDKDYMEGSGWDEERSSAWEYIAQIMTLQEHHNEALAAIGQAIEIMPTFPQYYIAKARIYAYLKDYKKAKHWLMIATNIEMPKTTLMMSPRDMKVRSLECDAQIAMSEHDLKKVAQDYKILLEIDPGNEVYKQNLLVAESLEAANRAGQSIVYLGRYLTQIGEEAKVLPLIQAVPNDLQKEPFYAQMRHKHIPPRMWEDNEIAILCGPGFEQWSPKSIEKGIGGSEEAVIYMSQELTKLGWKVTVYANPEHEEGVYDGVEYLNYYKLNAEDLFNHLILWRAIGFVDVKPRVRGKLLLWMHDMPNIPDFTEDRLKQVSRIAVLSEFHQQQVKQFVPGGDPVEIEPSKFFVTGNGIPELGIEKWEGDPHRMCYVSSADRGLVYLLRNWATIREQVPDATLHVYYGWQTYDMIHRNNPARMRWKEKIMAMMTQDGIVYHGRVSHNELAQEMNKAGIWAYPTDFPEISCISAMKAQATGAVPVVTNFGALQETVKNGVKVDVDIQDKDGQKAYVDALVDMLQHPEKQEELRDLKWAQEHFAWTRVAHEWNEMLGGRDNPDNFVLTPSEFREQMLAKKAKNL